ncbi:hypothetical protein [Actibacterium lipolyticum]|uniref:Dihydrodipicolinate reductase n=1 Tax=Actibacterium lipolyticum TaxID=1524263 RepID=A0A238KJ61_9RHOB|nr:hypothetical protein [Actibacterium lipolyticum]SMX42096.1 hypothetical protein COL8621_01887 [Actibacterium lipolyticum]
MRIVTASLATALTLLCAAASAQDGFRRIETAQQFQDAVVGKTLRAGDTYVEVRRNRKLTGKINGEPFTGAWEWRGAYFCRTIKLTPKNTDCQLWEVNGNQHSITRNKGTGKRVIYVAD